MKLEIVTHCVGLAPQFALHLASLATGATRNHVVSLKIAVDREEEPVRDVLKLYASRLAAAKVNVEIDGQERSLAMNRSIARNSVAARTQSDWIWFSGCHWLVGPHFLDKVCDVLEKMPADVRLAFPRWIMRPRRSDQKHWLAAGKAEVGYADLEPERCCRSGGTAMFVRASALKDIGYLRRNAAAHKPAPNGWQDQRQQDVLFRESLKTVERVFFARYLLKLW